MKRYILFLVIIIASLAVFSQEEEIEKVNELSNKIDQLDNKIKEIENATKSTRYKLYNYKNETSEKIKSLDTADENIIKNAASLQSSIEQNKTNIENTSNDFENFKSRVSRQFFQFEKNFRFDLFVEAGLLILIIGIISLFLFRFSRKNRHELADLKREVDFEIKTNEKQAISEIREIKEEMKKYKNPEALKHGPAFHSLREEFIKEIQDAKDIFIGRVNALSEKYEKEVAFTKERVDKEVIDFKHQIQKEIDELLEKIEAQQNNKT